MHNEVFTSGIKNPAPFHEIEKDENYTQLLIIRTTNGEWTHNQYKRFMTNLENKHTYRYQYYDFWHQCWDMGIPIGPSIY